MDTLLAKERRSAPLHTPSGLGQNAVRDVSGALTALLADMLALYLKTKTSTGMFRDSISVRFI
jgi:starvation-inducible DNA-binding protein